MNSLKSIPLSDRDIYSKLQGRTNIIMYNQLNNVNDIEGILVDDSAVILYEKRPKNGHWVCIIRYLKKGVPTIEFFDSYGIFPDDEKRYIDKDFLSSSRQTKNRLDELLLKASKRYRIEYNNYRLQKKSSDIATCGRHVVSRILLKNLNIDEYNKLMNSFKQYGLSPDDVATIISEYV